ncbi:MAG: sodium/glutamate symporter [Pseudomonadota bacterium]
MSISPWFLLALSIPILLAGEGVLRRAPLLARLNIPVPVVGGLLFSALVLILKLTGVADLAIGTRVNALWWTWLVTPDTQWLAAPTKNLNLPLLVAFFTCIGLGAPLRVLRSGGRMLAVLLIGATLLAVLQNAIGVALAAAMGAPLLLGVVCGALTLVGGHGTALGFAPRFEQAGLASAATIAASAATFGLIAGGLLAGPLGAWLLRVPAAKRNVRQPAIASLAQDLRKLRAFGRSAIGHALLVAACVKAGAWVSFGLELAGASLPAYMGALLAGFAVRAFHDACGAAWLRHEVIGALAAVLLPLFLAVTLAALNLAELAGVAGPMLVILVVNSAATLAFIALIIWPLLGRDTDAGVACAGMAGFGIGSTATAVAAMDALTRERGAAPRATALVPPTGGFLIDLTNAPVISAFIHLLR